MVTSTFWSESAGWDDGCQNLQNRVKNVLGIGTVQKELVDPYCTVNYAGHTGKTQVLYGTSVGTI